MNPAFLDNMSWEMAEVYGAITDQILINLARHFPYYQYVSDVPTSAFAYQASMLAQMGQVSAETVQIIRNGLEDADLALQGVLEQAIIDAVKSSEPELLEATKKGVFQFATLPAVVAPEQMKAFQLYYQQASDKLNLVNTVMLESTRSAYQQAVSDVVTWVNTAERINATQTALDIATGEVVTGVSSWNTAVRHATDRMKTNGITGFIDHAGHQWGAEGYVAMDIRTTVFNTGRAAVWEMNQDFGNDLYVVSYHNGARPLCYDWQNKVISSTDNARIVYDLDGNEIPVYRQSDTSYGEAAGLFGINCKHYPSPFIPGVSKINGQPQDKETNDRVYAESQEQRRLERKIREEKRDLQMMQAQGASAEEIAAQREKIKQTSSDIDTFCNETGRARHRDREAVYTQREFPDADKYDVSQFEREQKTLIEDYYRKGGEQKNYTFDQLTPNEDITPTKKEFKTEKDYDDEIARLREQRHNLFQQDSYDKNETDRLLQDIFDIEDRKKAFVAQKAKESLDASVITTRPANEQSILKQFKRFDTTKRTEAEMLAQVNPNYSQGTRAWTHNCQRTVVAQEMVYRGYDVTVMPYNAKDAIGSSGIAAWDTPKMFWTDPNVKTVAVRSEFMSTVKDAFDEWGDGSRGIIRVKWQGKYGGNGHFIFARRVNGQTIFEDPQTNKVLNISETLKKTTTGRNQMWVMRVDNRDFSNNITLAVKNRE